MVRRLWLEGSVVVDQGGKALDAVRRTIQAAAERFDTPVAESGGRGRRDLVAAWEERGCRFGALVALRLDPADPRRVWWLIAGASARAWRAVPTSPIERFGLLELEPTDSGGVGLSVYVTPVRGMSEEGRAQFLDVLVATIDDPNRTTALFVMHDQGGVRDLFNPWPGLVEMMAVDEDIRQALNARLLARSVPAGKARLYPAPCDELPDAVVPAQDFPLDGPAIAAIARLITTRQQTELPEGWREDETVAAWWDSDDPLRLPAAVEDEPVRDDSAEQLKEARTRIAALRADLATTRGALRAAERRTTALQEELRVARDDAAGSAEAELRTQLHALQDDLDLHLALVADVEAERDSLKRHNALLLAALARHNQSTVPAPRREVFDSFGDLLAAADQRLPGLRITANPAHARTLDHHQKAAVWREKAWDALLTLQAYADARRTDPGAHCADLVTFARGSNPGAMISPTLIALRESEYVMGNTLCREARVFPVDPTTDPTGRALMAAHIRLDRYPPAPRIHFLDDTTGAGTGVLYVGYLGAHLPNAHTN